MDQGSGKANTCYHTVRGRVGACYRPWFLLTCFWVLHLGHFLVNSLSYLCFVWMLDLLPQSYYDLESPVVWWHVLAQFVVVDFLTYINHRIVRIVEV